MDSLMLLGGQFLQARIRDEYRRDRQAAAWRERAWWDSHSERDFGIRAVVMRVCAAVVVLAVVFAGLASARSAENAQPSFTPFKLATWSDSIGR